MKKNLVLGLAGLASVAALMLSFASPAEARIVCREGWRWDRARCVEIRHVPRGHRDYGYRDHGYREYVVGGYIPRGIAYRPVPRSYYMRYQLERVPVGYSYVLAEDGNVVLLDRGYRIVRVWR